ncbi:uncharacterized protein LOC135692704 [Rhopilema esculentum]|uniref:uncharacterized protein LOC135692704 n=1 Tax=Rhopilema esculentum TaxID=499914 RepID=UPI0031D5AB61
MEEIFMTWENSSEFIIKMLQDIVYGGEIGSFLLHVFVEKNTSKIFVNRPWIVVHESQTIGKDAVKVNFIAFLVHKYGMCERNGLNKTRSLERKTIYLVQHLGQNHEELLALLRLSNICLDTDMKLLLIDDNSRETATELNSRNYMCSESCKFCDSLIKQCVENRHSLPCRDTNNENVDGTLLPHPLAHVQGEGSVKPFRVCDICNSKQEMRNDKEGRKTGNISVCGFKDICVVCLFSKHSSCLKVIDESFSNKKCTNKDLHRIYNENAKKTGVSKEEKFKKPFSNIVRKECLCTEASKRVCFTYLLSKLNKSVTNSKLGRSQSAPKLFVHGSFKQSATSSRRMESVTRDFATSTEDIDSMEGFERSNEVLFAEKATDTLEIQPIKVLFDKSTSSSDLEIEVREENANDSSDIKSELNFFLDQDHGERLDFSCKFCPKKSYRSKELLAVHMRNNHKKCNCPCQNYFKTRDEYLAHFYSVYPLPCLVDKKCPERFRNLYYQSLHHKESHHAEKPFFCIPCHNNNIERGMKSRSVTFKDVASLRIHSTSYGHNPQKLYLVSDNDKIDDSNLPFSMRCSGINYC